MLDALIPNEPDPTPKAPYNAWLKHVDGSIKIESLMLSTMILYLHKDLEHLTTYDIITPLKGMF